MKKSTITVAVAALLLAGTAAAGNKSGEKFRAELRGSNEVPPVTTDARGDFRMAFDDFDATATFRIRLDEASRVFMAHIHCAPEGQNGPIAVWLAGRPAGTGAWDVDGKWVDNATFTDADVIATPCGSTLGELIEAIREGNAYVNVHTQSAPGGELRGQIEER